jgi:hypothetical protein
MREIEVKLPDYDRVPRWLILQQEIDMRLFLLERITDEDKRRSGIARLIDEATGYDKKVNSDAETIMAELRWLKKEYDKCD